LEQRGLFVFLLEGVAQERVFEISGKACEGGGLLGVSGILFDQIAKDALFEGDAVDVSVFVARILFLGLVFDGLGVVGKAGMFKAVCFNDLLFEILDRKARIRECELSREIEVDERAREFRIAWPCLLFLLDLGDALFFNGLQDRRFEELRVRGGVRKGSTAEQRGA
jgi:hypothetical protein